MFKSKKSPYLNIKASLVQSFGSSIYQTVNDAHRYCVENQIKANLSFFDGTVIVIDPYSSFEENLKKYDRK
jgi:hypothetical protein